MGAADGVRELESSMVMLSSLLIQVTMGRRLKLRGLTTILKHKQTGVGGHSMRVWSMESKSSKAFTLKLRNIITIKAAAQVR